MVSTPGSFIALYTAAFSLFMGMGLLGTLLSLRMTSAGFSPLITGLVQSAYYFGLVLGATVCQRLVQRVGHIRAFAALAAVSTATVMLHGLGFSALFWALLRLVAGMAGIGLYMVIESWLNECTMPSARGRVFSLYMMLTYAGIGLGQLLLNLGDTAGGAPFCTAGILLALCLVPVSLTTAIAPDMPQPSRSSLRTLLRETPLGVLGCFAAGMINSGFYALGPVFGHAIGSTVPQLSLLMSAAVLGGLALQWTVGGISDRFDRTLVLPTVALFIVLTSLLVMVAARVSFPALLVAMVLFGGVGFALYPVAVARGHDLCEPHRAVAVSAGLLLSYGLGAGIGPVLAAAMMSVAGASCGLFAFTAAVAGIYAALSAWLRTLESVTVVPVEDQGAFMPMERTSAVAMVIDPRAEPDPATGDASESGP